jgi:murein DD-endopeptidase MepM/ murein hydrolase activator NlpD
VKKLRAIIFVCFVSSFLFSLKPSEVTQITIIDTKSKSRKLGFCGEWVYISKKDNLIDLLAKHQTDPGFFHALNGSDENTKLPGGFWFFPDASQKECHKSLSYIPQDVKWYYPVRRAINVTSHIGERWLRRKKNVHVGIDIKVPIGTRIYSMADGVVRGSLYNPNLGNFIVIEHCSGTRTLYAHLSRRFVTTGERVQIGQTIGMSGNTGNSTGPHLHLEMKHGDTYINALKVINY